MLSPSTELDAVNTMLTTIGESPVSTVEDNGVVDAAIALQILRSVSREVQAKGWHFNTEKEYVLTPTYLDGELIVPKNAIQVDTVGEDQHIDVVQRGTRLYDRREHTYKFTKSVKVDMVVLLEYDELPEAARQYISLKAARIFQERVVGSQELSSFNRSDEARALATLQETDAENADYNILSDNYSVARVLDRYDASF